MSSSIRPAGPLPWGGPQLPGAHLMLASAPLLAIVVVVSDLFMSDGLASPRAVAAWVLVVAFYAVQAFVTVRTPAWAETWWTPVVVGTAMVSSPLSFHVVQGGRPPVAWFWLIGPTVMLACYLCPPARAVVVGVAGALAGLLFAWMSGMSLVDRAGLLACGTVVNLVPGAGAALVLGRLRRREHRVLQQAREDPVTGVLNRRGLEHEIEAWSRRSRELRVAVLSVRLDSGSDPVSTEWAGASADEVMTRAGSALDKAGQGPHLVARFVDQEFVVVGEGDPDLLVPALTRAVRPTLAQHHLSPSVGMVEQVPVQDLATGLLVPVLERARQLGAHAALLPDGVASEQFDPRRHGVGVAPTPRPWVRPQPGDGQGLFWSEVEGHVLGWWMAATALLASAAPLDQTLPPTLVVVAWAATALLVAGGTWLSMSQQGPAGLPGVLIVLSVPVAVTGVVATGDDLARSVLLLLPTYPVLLAGTLLSWRWLAGLLAVLPLSAVVALSWGDQASSWVLTSSVQVVAFTGLTALLAAHVRRRSGAALDQLYALTLTDPTTGVLTREGLVRQFLDLQPSERSGVVLASVQARRDEGETVQEADLVRVAGVLHELARGRGLVGRVGGREMAMVVSSADRLPLLRRRLDAGVADLEVPVRVLVGLSHTEEHSEAGLWAALSRADAEVRRQRSEPGAPTHLVPAGPSTAR